MRAILDGTLVVGVIDGDVSPEYLPVPADLRAVPWARLRVIDGAVVDAESIAGWWVDEDGRKQAAPLDPAWQPLTCAWDTPLTRGPTGWAVTPAGETLRAYAAAKRYQVETGGTVVDGVAIATDRQSQSMLSSALAYLQQQPEGVVRWKTPSGVFVDLDLAALTAAAMGVAAHVQRCFAREAEAVAGIAAGTISTTAEIDAAFDVF